jgi:hypothetical protein
MLLPSVTLSEAKRLMCGWTRATFATLAFSIRRHFDKHGSGVVAADVWQYLRKAQSFRQHLRGARRITLDDGKVRYAKNGRFIILDALGRIVSFGVENENDAS